MLCAQGSTRGRKSRELGKDMTVAHTRLIFINAHLGPKGTHQLMFPNHPFSAYGIEYTRLAMVSFDLKRDLLYNINSTNNTFYAVSSDVYREICIEPGHYSSYDGDSGLVQAVQEAIDDAIRAFADDITAQVAFDPRSHSLCITLEGAPADLRFVCFHCRSGVRPVGVSEKGFFNDAHEILGAMPTRDVRAILDAFEHVDSDFKSSFPTSLSSLDVIYVRTNLQANNFRTTSRGGVISARMGLTESSVFARIAVPSDSGIHFYDAHGCYNMCLTQKSLDGIEFEITDGKGRPLYEHVSDPKCLVPFGMVLRWEVLIPDA